jgi:hypothetical protein
VRSEFIALIQPLCDLGFVVDFVLDDGSCLSGVLLGVSSSALIVDRWDGHAHRPAGEPAVVDLDELVMIRVP